MAFVSRILHDMDFHSEAWLRRQFHDFTLSFLNRVGRQEAQADLSVALTGLFPGVSIMQPRIAKFAELFPSTSLWKQYRTKQDEVWGGGGSVSSEILPSTVIVPLSANSPMTNAVEESSSFLSNKLGIPSLSPFLIENALCMPRMPTGFISVNEHQCKNPASLYEGGGFNTCVNRWVKVQQQVGDSYYWNVSSGETKWEIPDDDLL